MSFAPDELDKHPLDGVAECIGRCGCHSDKRGMSEMCRLTWMLQGTFACAFASSDVRGLVPRDAMLWDGLSCVAT
jgi:hypothetical protein